MKKILVLLACTALFASCAKSDKCKCSFQAKGDKGSIELTDQIVSRPEDKNCSDLKLEDVKIDNGIIHGSIDLSKIGSIKCVNHNE